MSTIASKVDAGTYSLDPVHSHVSFAVKYVGGTFRGSFSPVDATLEVGEDGIKSLRGSTKAASIQLQNPDLTGHLQSPDFFDAENAPELTFESTNIETNGNNVKITGNLSLRGTSQPVTLEGTVGEPVTDPYNRSRIGLAVRGTIDRTAFGINWQNPLPNGDPALANDVELNGELFFVKQDA
jgi:polyisoprenoid-binding protein YceI